MNNKKYIRPKQKQWTNDALLEGITTADFVALSKAITLCESTKASDRLLANQLISDCLKVKRDSIRIGITGVPGVGKSTFIEAFGLYLINELGKKVAVLAVDPSSGKTGGSILGDKTRMNELSIHPDAFVRPSPSAGALGGVAHASRESIIMCEAAGYDVILVETVGVGQSETEVHQMTDFFLLLMLAGAGDELQGIKRGIMEMADGILINKADGDNLKLAKNAKREYQNALHLFPKNENSWTTKVDVCSAIDQYNLESAWQMIEAYNSLTKDNGYFEANRATQMVNWFEKSVNGLLQLQLFSDQKRQQKFEHLKAEVKSGSKSPLKAAEELLS